jgi:hypothetical protein
VHCGGVILQKPDAEKRYCGVKGFEARRFDPEFTSKPKSRHRQVRPGEAGSAATIQNIPSN